MVNIDKLRGVIKEKRETVETLANAIGIDRATLYRRLNSGGEDFTVKEVDSITRYLNLDVETAMCIFFSSTVA